jgi:hypothetical protein
MRTCSKHCLVSYVYVVSVLVLLSFPSLHAQGTPTGKLITVVEADSLFGGVQIAVNFTADSVQNWLAQTDSVIMFSIRDGQLFVLGDHRKVIAPPAAVVNPDEVFHLYSKSKVEELLHSGAEPLIDFEQRKSVMTIKDGSSVLEFGDNCPPNCN